MADRGDTHYHVPTLNLWFLGSSVFFLLTMVWTVLDDSATEWKDHQIAFREIELRKNREEEARLEAQGALASEEALLAKVAAAQVTLDGSADELGDAEQAVFVQAEQMFKAGEAFKRAKANLAWEVFQAEASVPQGKEDDPEFDVAGLFEEKLATFQALVRTTELASQLETAQWEVVVAKVDALKQIVTDAEGDLASGTRALTLIRERIDNLDPAAFAKKAAYVVRDFPGIDFIGPNLKVRKYVLEHITFNLNFTTKPRIDMCTTCHVGIDQAGFEDEEQPYTTHPRLDLYLTSKSPHPVKEVGCTSCHRGSGESLSFQHVDHRPSDDDEAERWHHDFGWHKQHHWDYPMLREENVEAGCVQCHKTSMELIAEDAPTLFKGYELFETKGCYACHKVDWYPTKRKPGPTLQNLAAKLDPSFVYSWISKPRDFRPKTHMPQVFHLENFDAEAIIAITGDGHVIKGKAWNDTAVAAITTFLFDLHPKVDLPPIPAGMQGDAERGREVMNLASCFACHNTEQYEDAGAEPPLLSNHSTGNGHGVGRNEMGPDLRGVASKVSKQWIYHWLIDPKSYWPDTRMPDPRLNEQDALDVATYIDEDPDGIFHDVPDDWTVDAAWQDKLDVVVLEEQARWFYTKGNIVEIEDRLKDGEWSDVHTLAVKVGEAFVTNQGCFSCHLIDGMEDFMPIGTELSSWSTKTIDKLDFGQHYLSEVSLPAAFVAENGITERTLDMLDHNYREGWLERKLSHPRVYDLDKVKSPKDKLRMPWFDLSEDEIKAIATFVLGQVEDEVGLSAMAPSDEQLSADTGMRAVRQNNCLSCHMVEPPTVTYLAEDGITKVTVAAEIKRLFNEDLLPPRMTSLEDLLADVQTSEEFAEEEVEEFGVLLLEVDPDHGLPMEGFFLARDRLVAVTPGVGGDFIRHVTEYYRLGTAYLPNEDFDPDDPESGPAYYPATLGWDEDASVNLIEDVDGGQSPYPSETYDKVRWTFAPPVLINEGHKLQTDWFYAFLKDPQTVRHQIRVKMPKFHYDDGEAEAVADYFASKSRWEWHARYAKTLRAALGRTIKPDLLDGSVPHDWDLPRQAMEWPVLAKVTDHGVLSIEDLAARTRADPKTALKAADIAAIEAGSKPETLAKFEKLKAFGDSVGFSMAGPIKTGHELVQRRTPTYKAAHPGQQGMGEDVALKGPNCYTCHDDPNDAGPFLGLEPVAWAPPLDNVRSRLREPWVREWLWSPALKYPGTVMPENFTNDEHQYDELYPGSTNEMQIEAVLDWLYNMDRPRSQ